METLARIVMSRMAILSWPFSKTRPLTASSSTCLVALRLPDGAFFGIALSEVDTTMCLRLLYVTVKCTSNSLKIIEKIMERFPKSMAGD